MAKAMQNYQKKQNKILATARCLFLSRGYQNTCMDQVAKESGVTKQTVYRYFPSKLKLFRAVLEGMASAGRHYTFGEAGVREELEAFAREFVTLHLTEERLGLFRLIIAESAQIKEVGKVFFEIAPSARHKNLASYISKKLQTKDPLKDAKIFAAMLLHIRTSILFGVADIPDSDWIEAHCSYVIDLFLSGRKLL